MNSPDFEPPKQPKEPETGEIVDKTLEGFNFVVSATKVVIPTVPRELPLSEESDPANVVEEDKE